MLKLIIKILNYIYSVIVIFEFFECLEGKNGLDWRVMWFVVFLLVVLGCCGSFMYIIVFCLFVV